MKRLLVFVVALIAMPLIAGLYGALHDQLSYSVSPEYFTRFKYGQFGFEPEWFGGHRPTVAIIGFLATWWVGAIAALFIAPLGLMFKDAKTMRREVTRAVLVMFAIALLSGLLGLAIGWCSITEVPSGWYLPEHLTDPHAFLAVGSMHNFSYAGGTIGLCAAVTVMVWRRRTARGKPVLRIP